MLFWVGVGLVDHFEARDNSDNLPTLLRRQVGSHISATSQYHATEVAKGYHQKQRSGRLCGTSQTKVYSTCSLETVNGVVKSLQLMCSLWELEGDVLVNN